MFIPKLLPFPSRRDGTWRILALQDILAPQEMSGGTMPPELDAEELDALYEERDQLVKELDEDVD